MTQNQRLVDYFTNEFYQFEVTSLSHSASPYFTFTINSSAPMDFKEFSNRRRFLFLNAAITHGQFYAIDDMNFYANVEILTLEGDRVSGNIMFQIKDDLLQKVEVNYDLTEEEYRLFFDALFENYTTSFDIKRLERFI